MDQLSSLCNRLSIVLLALTGATAIYSVVASNDTAWTVAAWFLVPGLALLIGGKILEFLESLGGVSGRARVVLLAVAAVVVTYEGVRFAGLRDAYSGVVVRKSVDPWRMFSRGSGGAVRYNIVVRDARGNESTHSISDIDDLRIRVGDTVVKGAGFSESVHRVTNSQ